MIQLTNQRTFSKFLVSLIVALSLMAGHAQAKMVSTDAVIHSAEAHYSQQQLQSALASEELKQQLTDMGVDTEQLDDRISSLTPDEIQELNAELAEQPAGGGILGVLLTVFIVFVVTDMLCATDIFDFVKCIN